MNKYNIKVGDYVETWDGAIGYVTDTTSNAFAFYVEIDGKKFKHKDGQYSWYPYCLIDEENVFKRIGLNIFLKRKNEFELIEKIDLTWDTPTIISNTYIKLNELIDHINAIQERLNKYDSKRTD